MKETQKKRNTLILEDKTQVPGYHGGMIDHNTRRVLLSFIIIVFLTFDPCFRQVTSDSSKGVIVTIVLAIVLLLL
jgi:hypothetical protein